jgi:hypothetical protein
VGTTIGLPATGSGTTTHLRSKTSRTSHDVLCFTGRLEQGVLQPGPERRDVLRPDAAIGGLSTGARISEVNR